MRILQTNEVEKVSGGLGIGGAIVGAAITGSAVIGNSMLTGEWNGLKIAVALGAGAFAGFIGNPMSANLIVWRLNIAFSGGVATGVVQAYSSSGKIGTVTTSGVYEVVGSGGPDSTEQSMYDPEKDSGHIIGQDENGNPIYGSALDPSNLRRFMQAA